MTWIVAICPHCGGRNEVEEEDPTRVRDCDDCGRRIDVDDVDEWYALDPWRDEP